MLEHFRDKEMEALVERRKSDVEVVTSEVQTIQAISYYGDLVLSFKGGLLKPICRLDQTKKII